MVQWDWDDTSDTSRISYVDDEMHLYSRSRKQNWMCFFSEDVNKNCMLAFDIEDYSGLDEIQVSFYSKGLKDRYRFMIRNNRTAVFEVVKNGVFYKYIRQKKCDITLGEKHNIKVITCGKCFAFFVDEKMVFSLRCRKDLIDNTNDNRMIMIFYNKDGEINCKVSSIVMGYTSDVREATE